MKRHIGKFEDLKEVVKASKNETIYKCPYCDIVSDRGPDTEGKFYFNTKKGKGHCFRCETLVFYDGIRPLEWLLEELNPKYTAEDFIKGCTLNRGKGANPTYKHLISELNITNVIRSI